MKLFDLDAAFIRYTSESLTHIVDTLAEADGVQFQCPKCAIGLEAGEEDGRRFVRGAHYVRCWFRGKVPDTAWPLPGRWDVAGGSGLQDLQLTPSIQITSGCSWHGFVGSAGVPPGEVA